MTIKTISHSESREYVNSQGLKRWKKKSIDAEIDLDTEDVYECYGKLEDIVNTSLGISEQAPSTDLQPQITDHNRGYEFAELERNTLAETIGDLPTQINSCTDKKVLGTYKFLVKNKPELEQLYLNKLEELSK